MEKEKQNSLRAELSSHPRDKARVPGPPHQPHQHEGWTRGDDTRIVWDPSEWPLLFGKICFNLLFTQHGFQPRHCLGLSKSILKYLGITKVPPPPQKEESCSFSWIGDQSIYTQKAQQPEEGEGAWADGGRPPLWVVPVVCLTWPLPWNV